MISKSFEVCRFLKTNLLLVITVIPPLIVGLTAISSQAVAVPLKAGVARVDLTPPTELKVPLGSYGARMSEPAIGVHDRIFSKCIVISDGDKRFALVTADVLAFPPGFRSAVIEFLADANWKSNQIMLLPSHSHTSIDMSSRNPRNILKIPQIGFFHKELYDLTVARLAQLITPQKTVSGCLRLGNLLIVKIPGELTAQLGMSTKLLARQITGIQHVVVGGLANEWVSYILSAEEYKKGGYEASVSFYEETLGQVIVEGALKRRF